MWNVLEKKMVASSRSTFLTRTVATGVTVPFGIDQAYRCFGNWTTIKQRLGESCCLRMLVEFLSDFPSLDSLLTKLLQSLI